MGLYRTKEISEAAKNAIENAYEFKIVSTSVLNTYLGGVFNIDTDEGNSYVLKLTSNPKLDYFDSIFAFCDFVNTNISEFVTQRFIPNHEGKRLHKIENDEYFYLLEKREIIRKDPLTDADQQMVGNLMRVFHTKLKDFRLVGIGGTSWMREMDDDSQLLFLKNHVDEKKFESYIKPLNYEGLGLQKTLIHGDWHDGNMSFSNPPFVYDLDTLSYGSPAEEVARALTHWDAGTSDIKAFHDNLIKGYEMLDDAEVKQIPKIAVAICYKAFVEIGQFGDMKTASDFADQAENIKSLFNV